MLCDIEQVSCRSLQPLSVSADGLPTDRQRGNAALPLVVGQQSGQDRDQIFRIGEPGRITPVRFVDAVLHDRLVEIAVRKTIEGIREQTVLTKEVAQLFNTILLDEFARCLRRKPEAYAHRFGRAHALFHRQRMLLKIGFGLIPRCPRMHVGAIAEDRALPERITHRPCRQRDQTLSKRLGMPSGCHTRSSRWSAAGVRGVPIQAAPWEPPTGRWGPNRPPS